MIATAPGSLIPSNGAAGQPGGRFLIVMGASTSDREQMTMIAIALAVVSGVLFLFCTFGLDHLGSANFWGLAGAFLAFAVACSWTPWRRTA